MRSKSVNSIVGGMNLLFGLLVLAFKFYLPNPQTATVQELTVINEINKYIFALMIIVAIVNFIALISNSSDTVLLFGYIVSIASTAFYFIDVPFVAIFYVLAGLIIEIQVLRENMLYTNNVTFMAITSIVIVAIGLVGINILTYKDKVQKKVEKDNIGYLQYDEEYFKNISELGEDGEFYLNVERNGKWGYINVNGETKIGFEFDFASPFITIEKYEKEFDIALVVKEETASIILKNQREVMSFKNEIAIDNYEKQMEKLQELCSNEFGQEWRISEKLSNVPTSNIKTIPAYQNYPYRYRYNDDYDIYITVSQTGSKNKYEFIKHENSDVKVSIDCDALEFDSDYLYVYSNGYLPYYKNSENIQGWFDKDTRKTELEGKLQVLEFFDDNILIKDYESNSLYFANQYGDKISPVYKDIFVLENGYIVKRTDGKFVIIDKEFNEMMDIQYDYIYPGLMDRGILICANLPLKVNFNNSGFPCNIEYDILNLDGQKISLKNPDGTEIENPAYTGIFYTNNKKNVASYEIYLENLTNIDYTFLGEEFYK